MHTLTKYFIILILSFYFEVSSAQNNYMQINLEVKSLLKDKNIRFSLFQQDSIFYLGIKKNPKVDFQDPQTWSKRDADKVIVISKGDFYSVIQKCMELSSIEIIKGFNHTDTIYEFESSVNLEIDAIRDCVSFKIDNPTYRTKERRLDAFLDICKEIFEIAKMRPGDYL